MAAAMWAVKVSYYIKAEPKLSAEHPLKLPDCDDCRPLSMSSTDKSLSLTQMHFPVNPNGNDQ